MTPLDVRPVATGVRVRVYVQPRAARAGFAGLHGTALKVRLTAPPVDGAANEALVAFLAEALRVPRRAVRIVSGHTARAKVVELDGVQAAQVERIAAESG